LVAIAKISSAKKHFDCPLSANDAAALARAESCAEIVGESTARVSAHALA
jgi:hypothetical protein